jgi:hypothetical protein
LILKLIKLFILGTIQLLAVGIGLFFFFFITIFSQIHKYITTPNAIEEHKKTAKEIRSRCEEMGVPTAAYYQIINFRMDEAKAVASEFAEQDGGDHQHSSWNKRLSVAIATIYNKDSLKKKG